MSSTARVESESFERHQHATDLFPGEWLAVDDDQWQVAVRIRVPFDASDKTLVRREPPAEFGALDVAPRHFATHLGVQIRKSSQASVSRSPSTRKQ